SAGRCGGVDPGPGITSGGAPQEVGDISGKGGTGFRAALRVAPKNRASGTPGGGGVPARPHRDHGPRITGSSLRERPRKNPPCGGFFRVLAAPDGFEPPNA